MKEMDWNKFRSKSYSPPNGYEHSNYVTEDGIIARVILRQDTGLRYDLDITDLAIAYALSFLYNDQYFLFNEYKLEKALALSKIKAGTIYTRFKKIRKNEFIESNNSDSLILKLIKNKQPQFFVDGKTCEWCMGTSPLIEKHHFPIPRKNGGKEVVNICANCHGEYHFLKTRGLNRLKSYREFYPYEE